MPTTDRLTTAGPTDRPCALPPAACTAGRPDGCLTTPVPPDDRLYWRVKPVGA